jgi:ferredoxin--NADP+ reductase
VTIGLNREADFDPEGEDRPASVRRAMSIASAPQDRGFVELYIRYVEKPESSLPLTHLLWRRPAGSRIWLRSAAAGHFTIHHAVGDADRRLKVLVAAGTGLAPFLSMARARLRDDPRARLDDLAILHGASYAADLGYRDELEQLARDHGLRYVPTVSRPAACPGWIGRSGRVEALFGGDELAELERDLGLGAGGLVPERAVVLVCGLNGTIAACLDALVARGFVPGFPKIRRALGIPEEAPTTLFWEQYDAEPVIDVHDESLTRRMADAWRAATQG